MDTDRNLLLGVLALQAEMITPPQFIEACAAWAAAREGALADLLVARGWLEPVDRELVEKLLDRRLARNPGSAPLGLLAAVDDARIVQTLRDAQAVVSDPLVHQSLADLQSTATGKVAYLSTLGHVPDTRNRYTLTSMHAKGGLGQVWLARDTELDREVALKELRPEQAGNARVLRRFLQEARITSQLNHPGIVPVYELARGQEGPADHPYYTMRFIQGRTLSDAVASYHHDRLAGQATSLDLLALVQAFLGVCNTVAYAHSRNVIHRDLKGLNIILGDFGEVILLDWGLAKLVNTAEDDPTDAAAWNPNAISADTGLTVAGQAVGTPAFMAPEQAAGQIDKISKLTDVYGLGAILYEILAGRPPFGGASTADVLRKVREESPPAVRGFNPDAPAALVAVCLKALAKEPTARYASAAALADEIRHWIADEPVSAYPEPWHVRTRRWVGRHRTLVASAAAALVMACLGLAALAASEARRSRDLAASLARESAARNAVAHEAALSENAVDALYSGISEEVILRRPELSDLRRKLLGTALGFYDRLIQRADDRPESVASTNPFPAIARSYQSIALLQFETGDREAALETQKKTISAYDRGDPQARNPINARIDLAWMEFAAGRPDDALASMRAALDRAEAAHKNAPSDTSTHIYVHTLNQLGLLRLNVGPVAEAARLFTTARDAENAWVDDLRIPSRRELRITTCHGLGLLARQHGQLDDARRFFEEALRLAEENVAQNPDTPFYQSQLRAALNEAGRALAEAGQPVDGLGLLQRGLTYSQGLLARKPTSASLQADVAWSHAYLAQHLSQIGNLAAAITHIDQAETLLDRIAAPSPGNLLIRAQLAALRAHLAGFRKPDDKLTPAERQEREKLTQYALERLQSAVRAGIRNPQRVLSEPAFQFLRQQPNFLEILKGPAPKG